MKKQLAILATLLTIVSTAVAQNSGLRFTKTSHNFGRIEEGGGTVSHTFPYTNNSDQPLVIIEVQTTCGCTTPHFDRSQINPAATGQITINYDPLNRPGRINRSVRVVTNIGHTDLIIDGEVNPRQLSLEEGFQFALMHNIRMDRFAITGLQTPLGSQTTTVMYVANASHTTSALFAIDQNSLPQGVTATVSTAMIAPRDVAEITITNHGTKYGKFNHNIRFIVNGLHAPETLTVEGIVVDNFNSQSRTSLRNAAKISLSRQYMNLGRVSKLTESEFSVMVRNDGNSPLQIRDVSSSQNLHTNITTKTIAPGKSAILKVTHRPAAEGYDQGYVRIVANDPASPVVEIRTVAEVF